MKFKEIPELTEKEKQRFFNKIIIDPKRYGDCWYWSACKVKTGHGKIGIRGSTYQAYRVSFKIFRGDVPNNLVLDHLICDNPNCVNPFHLKPCTIEENTMRSRTAYCAVKSKTTHCPKGHPLSGDNLWVRHKKGRKPSRECLECHRFRKRVANKSKQQNQRTRELARKRGYKYRDEKRRQKEDTIILNTT